MERRRECQGSEGDSEKENSPHHHALLSASSISMCNVQYKIMFDYISDIFTRLVCTRCMQTLLRFRLFHEFDICVSSIVHFHFHFSLYIFDALDLIAENPSRMLDACKNNYNNNSGRISVKYAFIHLFTHTKSAEAESQEPKQKHGRRIIYHLDAIEGSFFLVILSFITCFLSKIASFCLHTSSPNH